jgi:alginate O-acetyltransferase complex protein AlgI
MLFNSFIFAVFLPVVFALYWGVFRGVRAQNLLLIAAGFVFYGWWDWRFLLLLLATSLTDHGVALAMGGATSQRGRKAWLALSLIGNLGTLAVFKYHDFFARSLQAGLAELDIAADPVLLKVILPVGISFYTFQALSYTIDVYRRRIDAVRDPSIFLAFVSFFPQLCAGPIERASHMLPQFARQRSFDAERAVDGLRQMLWGFFKKIVIADNCSRVVDEIFSRSDTQAGPVLMLGAVLFAFQIYCDFGGYSDIAIGTARLFGFELMRNFAFPYFSRDIAEFWRRWHISLSSWFRDYVYIPLGGSKGGRALAVRNTFIIFLLSGFWHGANWTFLVWGLLNALYFLPLLLRGANRKHLGDAAEGRLLPGPGEALRMLGTFGLTCLAWVFFRADSVTQAVGYIGRIFTRVHRPGDWKATAEFLGDHSSYAPALACLFVMLAAEWLQRMHKHALEAPSFGRPMRWAVYIGLVLVIVFVGDHAEQRFIYFQF